MRLDGASLEITQPIYDTVQAAVVAGPQQINFFAVPIGGIMAGAVVKTRAQTNIVQAGRLERGNQITIQAISAFVRETAVGGARRTWADYEAFYNNTHFNIQLGQKTWLRATAAHIPSGGAELQYFSNIVAAATEYEINHGIGSWGNVWQMQHPVILEENESIQVECNIGDAIAAVTDITFVLWGQLLRPVG